MKLYNLACFSLFFIIQLDVFSQSRVIVDTSRFVIYQDSSTLRCSNGGFFIDLNNDSVNDLKIGRYNTLANCRFSSNNPYKLIYAQNLTNCEFNITSGCILAKSNDVRIGDSIGLGQFYLFSHNYQVVLYKEFNETHHCDKVICPWGAVGVTYLPIKQDSNYYLIKVNISDGDCFQVGGSFNFTTGIDKVFYSINEISLSYNHSQNELRIILSNINENGRLRAYSLNGSILFEESINATNTIINTDFLPSGMFLFEVYIKGLNQRKVIKVFKN